KEDEPKIAAVATSASQESVAQEATARQTLDENAPEADKAKAPNLGIGKDKGRLTADWGKQISAYFELHKRYPKVKKNKTATVKVSLVPNRLGNWGAVRHLQSPGRAPFGETRDPHDPPLRPRAAPAGGTDRRYLQLQPECEFQRQEVTNRTSR